MKFWRRNPQGEIEGRLRDERPQPSNHLVRAVERQIERELRGHRFSGSRAGRLGFAVALTVGLLASLAAFGGLSYAASTATSSASSAVKLAKVTVGLKSSAASAPQKSAASQSPKSKKGGGDDDDDRKKKKPRCNRGDDSDDPARDQYEDDDERDDCD